MIADKSSSSNVPPARELAGAHNSGRVDNEMANNNNSNNRNSDVRLGRRRGRLIMRPAPPRRAFNDSACGRMEAIGSSAYA